MSKTEETKKPLHPRREWINDMVDAQELERVVLLDGLDGAILGLVQVSSDVTVVAYSTKKILASLQEDGMDADDAQEYFDFNIAGAHFGVGSPVFVQDELEPV